MIFQGGKKGQGRLNSNQVRRMKLALVKETEDDSGAGAPRPTHPPPYNEDRGWAYTSDSEDQSDSGTGHSKGSREIASALASVRFAAIRLLLLLIKVCLILYINACVFTFFTEWRSTSFDVFLGLTGALFTSWWPSSDETRIAMLLAERLEYWQ
jgi:hypothetical protein